MARATGISATTVHRIWGAFGLQPHRVESFKLSSDPEFIDKVKHSRLDWPSPLAFETEDDVARHLPRFIDSYNERRLHSALGYLSPNRFEEQQPRKPVKSAA